MSDKELGALGEELARRYLSACGYKILLRNFRCVLGEIDVIARHRDTLVFVEVKTRASEEMGSPAESVTARKRARLARLASFYMHRYGIQDVPCRFDVVSVLMRPGFEPCLELIQDAFGAGR